MKKRITAVLLSAFVLPGMGQLYKGDKAKGAIFLTLVNIFFLSALFLVLKNMGKFLVTAKISGPDQALRVLETIRQSSPEIGWLLTAFLILWFAAVIDAALPVKHPDSNLSC